MASFTIKKVILHKFNDFFASIGDKLSSQLQDTNISPILQTNFFPSSFWLFPASQVEIFTIIQNLKVTKTNLNDIPINLFKKLANILKRPMTILINSSFNNGVFPDALKMARITQIYKA